MIIVISYYSDGSSKPETHFFPRSAEQVREVALHIADARGMSKEVEIYDVEALDRQPIVILRESTGGRWTPDPF